MIGTKPVVQKKPPLRKAILSFVVAVASLIVGISELHGWHIAAAGAVGGIAIIFGVLMLRRKYSRP